MILLTIRLTLHVKKNWNSGNQVKRLDGRCLEILESWDGVSEDDWQPYTISSSIVFEMVKETTQPQESYIMVVKEPSDELDTDSDSSASSDTSDSNDSSEGELQET